MTPDEFRRHACTRKVGYFSRRQARNAALGYQAHQGGSRVTPYRCSFSEAGEPHWHIGHGQKRGRRDAA